MRVKVLSILYIFYGAVCVAAESQGFEKMNADFHVPIYFDFLTSSTLVLSQGTSLSLVELNTGLIMPLVGSETAGGYVDGESSEARFADITDVVVQGNYMYIADYSCIRIYDIERKLVATLSGICGRMHETVTASVAPETFKGPLKMAVSARDLYVLDGNRVIRLDKETGASWPLSIGERLSEGKPTSIEIDKYTAQLFVTVAKANETQIISIDIASGQQGLYSTIQTLSNSHIPGLAGVMASIDIAPNGTIYVLQPKNLYSVDRKSINSSKIELGDYGYRQVAASSEYIVLSQEYYSRMYSMHILKLGEDEPSSTRQGASKEEPGIDDTNMMMKLFQSQAFHLTIVFPSILFLTLIIVIICATRKVMRKRKVEKAQTRPTSETSSEKYFLNTENTQTQDSGYWM